MLTIGTTTIGGNSLQTIAEGHIIANWGTAVTMTKICTTVRAYVFGRKNTEGSAQYKVSLYKKGATAAKTTLVGYATGIINSQTEKWWSVPFEVLMEAGESYMVALQFEGVTGWLFGWTSDGVTVDKDVGSFIPPATLSGAGPSAQEFSCYIEYVEGQSNHLKLLAPVDVQPMLTSGRNESGYSSGHEPKYVLDNDANTYWETDSFSDRSLYIDLGIDKAVDVIALWLHNYNEDYTAGERKWQVAYSDDDSTYIEISNYLFSNSRSDYVPIIIMTMASPIVARYWRITFTNFNVIPTTTKPEISAIWFLNDYSLPYYHQIPERNILQYNNYNVMTRALNELSQLGMRGRQRTLTRTYIFTADTEQWSNLLAAYKASRGGALPIIMQTEISDSHYRAVQFTQSLRQRQEEFGFYRPTIYLREIGFKRIPFKKRLLYPFISTMGWWRFNGNIQDDSGNDNHMYEYQVEDFDFVVGNNEQGKTALVMYDDVGYAYGYITSGLAGDFDMGMSDFTVEVTLLMPTGGVTSKLVQKGSGTPFKGYFLRANAAGAISVFGAILLGDGVNQITNIVGTGKDVGDGIWHYCVLVVDRGNDKAKVYIDGVQYGGDYDISSITGNISDPTQPLYIRSSAVTNITIDEVCISKQALTASEIITRYAGKLDYGNWGR